MAKDVKCRHRRADALRALGVHSSQQAGRSIGRDPAPRGRHVLAHLRRGRLDAIERWADARGRGLLRQRRGDRSPLSARDGARQESTRATEEARRSWLRA